MKYKLQILLSLLIFSCSENTNPIVNDDNDGYINSSLNINVSHLYKVLDMMKQKNIASPILYLF